jgi:hypothetical protein
MSTVPAQTYGFRLLAFRLLAGALILPLVARGPGTLAAQEPPAAESYLQRYSEIMTLTAAPDGVADVANLVIQRDVG